MLKQKNDRIALYIINIKQRKLEANKRARDLNKGFNRAQSLETM